jgi:hypothetical protein
MDTKTGGSGERQLQHAALEALAFLTASQRRFFENIIIVDNLVRFATSEAPWLTSSIYEDITTELSKIAVPTLIPAGDQARQIHWNQRRREKPPRIPGANVVAVYNSAHPCPSINRTNLLRRSEALCSP